MPFASERRRGGWSALAAKLSPWCIWLTFPIVGAVWAATRYDNSWYHLDEWVFIDRVTRSGDWSTAFEGFQGHLHAGSYVLFRLQRGWLGLEEHQLVYAAFCASIVGLQISVAGVLRRLGLPTLIAMLASSVVVFFGAGAQNTVWEFQLNANFALALCFTAAFVALGEATTKTAVATAMLLVLAIGFDSGLASFGAVYVGILVVFLWPRRLSTLALSLPAVLHLAWFFFGEKNEIVVGGHSSDTASVDTMLQFASHLFALAAGGLVGGRETVGAIALVATSACIVVGIRHRRFPRRVTATLLGGALTVLLVVGGLAKTRAYAFTPDELPGGRYVQWVAVFLLVACAPAITAAVRPASRDAGLYCAGAATAALIAVFVLNLSTFSSIRQFHESFGSNVKGVVRQIVTVLNDGCGEGRRPDPASIPSQAIPQFTVGQVQTHLAAGAFTESFGIPATPEVRNAVC